MDNGVPTPSDGDLHLLRALVTMTERQGGRPPTLAELTVALGYQASSRGNIQRRLARLRPVYVDWSSGSRALRVTPAGLALSGADLGGEASVTADLPAPALILHLLSSGLTHLATDVAEGRPLRAPYPAAWQRGINMLAAECIAAGVEPPTHTAAAVALCRRTVGTWPIRFGGPGRYLDSPLLDDDEPSALCRELAYTGDAEMEATERIMVAAIGDAKLHRSEAAYVALREYAIRQPVIAQEDLLLASFDAVLGPLGAHLHDLYERVPALAVDGGVVRLCGACGWTLERHQGQWRCGDERCRVLTDGFTVGTVERQVMSPLMRVRRAIRRYVVAPGRYEVETADALRTLGVTVELWPGYDEYDLRIHLGDGEIWAVDIKDYRFPHLLAPRLDALPHGTGYEWTRAFYAIPDARARENPSYLPYLHGVTAHPNGQATFEIVTLGDLVGRVRNVVRGGVADEA